MHNTCTQLIILSIQSFNSIDALEKLALVESRRDAKRIIKSKAVKLDDSNYDDPSFSLVNYNNKKEIKISVGKKKIGLVKFE